ncbi:hypothetical protein MIND_00688300 [Mycena indigotica]|uniref:Uncharacterized protein n=1 Tax=Mycena indigotica TaxID=2126181 RepID=A0A8H6SK77_9AGAR|nr:uncharacterized protein MIND_00688300 [Mycena indigotica]KAF7301235.1 hypothetical protein MIND_00688300 [Mycena indigotica]
MDKSLDELEQTGKYWTKEDDLPEVVSTYSKQATRRDKLCAKINELPLRGTFSVETRKTAATLHHDAQVLKDKIVKTSNEKRKHLPSSSTAAQVGNQYTEPESSEVDIVIPERPPKRVDPLIEKLDLVKQKEHRVLSLVKPPDTAVRPFYMNETTKRNNVPRRGQLRVQNPDPPARHHQRLSQATHNADEGSTAAGSVHETEPSEDDNHTDASHCADDASQRNMDDVDDVAADILSSAMHLCRPAARR